LRKLSALNSVIELDCWDATSALAKGKRLYPHTVSNVDNDHVGNSNAEATRIPLGRETVPVEEELAGQHVHMAMRPIVQKQG
jgi:hypothetical protein